MHCHMNIKFLWVFWLISQIITQFFTVDINMYSFQSHESSAWPGHLRTYMNLTVYMLCVLIHIHMASDFMWAFV
jgi:hypothetical protein